MFRWRSPFLVSLRLLQTHSVKAEPLLDRLKRCTAEYQVFQLLGMNRAALSIQHVSCAMNLLQSFQIEEQNKFTPVGQIRDHPEFIVLCTLAQNKVDLLDDKELVDVLHSLISFQVNESDVLMQQLIAEGWRRLERLDFPLLAKFALSLRNLELNCSPLMGQIASIVDKNLEDADNPATLSCFLFCLDEVSSPSLQERLIKKTEAVMHNFDVSGIQEACWAMKLFYKYKFTYASLLEKYDNFFKQNIDVMGAENLANVAQVYQNLHFLSSSFLIMAEPRLVEMINTCNDPQSFGLLFHASSRIVSPAIRDRLEEKLLTLIDGIQPFKLLVILQAVAEMQCNNRTLILKICTLLHTHLDSLIPTQLSYMTKFLVQLSYQNAKLLSELERHLQRVLIANCISSDVAVLAGALSLLNLNHVDEAVFSKIDAVIQNCNLFSMERIAALLMQLSKTSPFGNHHQTCRKLLRKLNTCALERLRHMENIDCLLNDCIQVKYRQWMTKELAEELLDTCQRLLPQVTWRNVTKLSVLLVQINYARAPLLDAIAAVTMADVTKIHPVNIHMILQPFFLMTLPQRRELFNVCLQHVLEHKDVLSPDRLVQVCYYFALAEHFSEELINTIFNITFLQQLDAVLKPCAYAWAMKFRTLLMDLNRAVCIEHPEYQVPWFHEPYCQSMMKRMETSETLLLQKVLEEILGGRHYVRALVTTPYCYTIDFEFMLDKNKKPIPYQEHDCVPDNAVETCELDGQSLEGAQRFAVLLLTAKAFCQNAYIKGPYVMEKRHLEKLGYNVVQIPSFEWNSLRKAESGEQILYLRKKLYADD